MKHARYFHSCTEIEDENGKVTKILVVGGVKGPKVVVYGKIMIGKPDMKYADSSEIYDVEKKVWQMGPKLNQPIFKSTLVTSPASKIYSAYLIGGHNGKEGISRIYGIKKDLSKWNLIGYMGQARYSHFALNIIPNSIKGCPTTNTSLESSGSSVIICYGVYVINLNIYFYKSIKIRHYHCYNFIQLIIFRVRRNSV